MIMAVPLLRSVPALHVRGRPLPLFGIYMKILRKAAKNRRMVGVSGRANGTLCSTSYRIYSFHRLDTPHCVLKFPVNFIM